VERIEGKAAVTHLALRHVKTGATSQLPVGGVFVFVGFRPNTGIVRGHFEHDAGGYFITNDVMMSSIPGLFAAGDVRAQLTRQVTTAVGDATTAVIAATRYLAEWKERQLAGATPGHHAD
jgi:thioredoxin reductase (NADPH)